MNGVPFITQWSFLVSRFLSPSQEMFVDSYLQAPPFCSSAPCFILIPRLIVMIAFIPSSLRSSSSFHSHAQATQVGSGFPQAREAAAKPDGDDNGATYDDDGDDTSTTIWRHLQQFKVRKVLPLSACNVIFRPLFSPALCRLFCSLSTSPSQGESLFPVITILLVIAKAPLVMVSSLSVLGSPCSSSAKSRV